MDRTSEFPKHPSKGDYLKSARDLHCKSRPEREDGKTFIPMFQGRCLASFVRLQRKHFSIWMSEMCLAMLAASLLPFFQQLRCNCSALLPSQHHTVSAHAEALKGPLMILLCTSIFEIKQPPYVPPVQAAEQDNATGKRWISKQVTGHSLSQVIKTGSKSPYPKTIL